MSVHDKSPLVNFLSSDTFVNAAKEAVNTGTANLTTLGFSAAFTFVGTLIYNTDPKSRLRRSLAKILGADIEKMDLNTVLMNLQKNNYFLEIGKKIHSVLDTGDINEFAKFLEISNEDAWNVFLKMKNVVMDRELYATISEITNSVNECKYFLNNQLPRVEVLFDAIPAKLDDLKKIADDTNRDTKEILNDQKKFLAEMAELKKMLGSRETATDDTVDNSKLLSAGENFALAYMMTDPEATIRGVWLYPFHQQLTYRGFTNTEVTLILSSLSKKGLIQHVDAPSFSLIDKRETTAPAYRVTDDGVSYIQKNFGSIPKLKDTYIYTLRLYGTKKANASFLDDLRGIDFVQGQTRFVNEDNKNLCRIGIFSYFPVNKEDIDRIARIHKTKIYAFKED